MMFNKPLPELLAGDLARLQEIHTTIPRDNDRIGALIGRLDIVFIHLSDHFLSTGMNEAAHAVQLIAAQMNKCALPNETLPGPWRQDEPTEEKIAATTPALDGDDALMCCVCGTRAANKQCRGCQGYFCDPHYADHLQMNALLLALPLFFADVARIERAITPVMNFYRTTPQDEILAN